MKIPYLRQNLGPTKRRIISIANSILEEYAAQGYDLTVRQLYYQFVARDIIPNNMRSYSNLVAAINDGRLNGYIDWSHIVDRTRTLRGLATWADPADRLDQVWRGYSIDKWKRQPHRPEVWVEKDALLGLIESACSPHQVDYFSCRGFTSQSEMWSAAQRIGRRLRTGQHVDIIHLGDHDPSGIDMSRDIEERINMFLARDNATAAVKNGQPWLDEMVAARGVADGAALKREYPEDYSRWISSTRQELMGYGTFRFQRIALNMDQIRQLNPPPNPAKMSDSRAKKYVERFGHESWELDALSPAYIASIIDDAVGRLRVDSFWRQDMDREKKERKMLRSVATNWKAVSEFLRSGSAAPSGPGVRATAQAVPEPPERP